MTIHLLKSLLLLLLFQAGPSLLARPETLAIDSIVHLLNARTDFQSGKFRQAAQSVKALDPVSGCEVWQRLNEKGPKRQRFRFQLLRLQVYLALESRSCPDWPPVEQLLTSGLQASYETRDPVLMAEMNRLVMSYYTNRFDFGSAGVYGLIARELEENAGVHQFYGSSSIRFFLGHCSYHSRDYRTSIQASMEALEWKQRSGIDPADTLLLVEQMNAWNTIGLSYEKLDVYDSAFWAFDKALEICQQLDLPFWEGLIKGNQGDVYFAQGRYAEAKAMLWKDVEASRVAEIWDNAANSLQWISRINLVEGNPVLALQQARESERWLHRIPRPEYHANLYYTYTQIFKALQQPDSMDLYMKRYLTLHDSLEHVAMEARAEIVRMRMDNQNFVYQIMTLDHEKKKIKLIRNLIILIILLAALTAYLLFHRAWSILKWRQLQALHEKEKAEADVKSAREQLQVFTEYLVEKTSLVEDLEARLLKQRLLQDVGDDHPDLEQITLLTDDDWERFKHLFERVHPGFFQVLRKKAPDITLAEQRMAALIKLQLPAKKAASILAISTNSVHKTRQRLRHRLGLEHDGALDEYFAGYFSDPS